MYFCLLLLFSLLVPCLSFADPEVINYLDPPLYSKVYYDSQGERQKQEIYKSNPAGKKELWKILNYSYGKDYFQIKENFVKNKKVYTYGIKRLNNQNWESTIYFEKPPESKSKIHSTMESFDKEGNKLLEYYLDSNNRLTENQYGIAKKVHIYNKSCLEKFKNTQKNCIELLKHFNSKGQLTKDENDTAMYKAIFNKDGKLSELKKFNEKGQPAESDTGIASSKIFYDKAGNEHIVEYYNHKGLLQNNSHGIARFTYAYDEKNNLIEEKLFDKDGNLKENNRGIAIFKYSYNDKGKKISEEYYNSKNELSNTSDETGICKITYSYNPNSQIVSIRYFRKTTEVNPVGYTIYQYDSAGKKNFEASFDDEGFLYTYEGKPQFRFLNFFKKKELYKQRIYDFTGRLYKELYFYPSGKIRKQIMHDKFSKYKYSTLFKYNKQGQIIRKYYYRNHKTLSFILEFKYNPQGLVSEEKRLNPSLTALSEDYRGIALTHYSYNSNCLKEKFHTDHCFSSIEYFDRWRKRKKETGSYEISESSSPFERPIEEDFKDKSSGISGYRFDYDEKGRRIKEEYFGEDGKLKSPSSSSIDSNARIVYTYDAKNQITSESVFDEEERPVFKLYFSYSEKGNLKEVKKLGPKNNILYLKKYFKPNVLLLEEEFYSNGVLNRFNYNHFLSFGNNSENLIHLKMDRFFRPIHIRFQYGVNNESK